MSIGIEHELERRTRQVDDRTIAETKKAIAMIPESKLPEFLRKLPTGTRNLADMLILSNKIEQALKKVELQGSEVKGKFE